MMDYEEEQPTTKLSVAFFVVVALHVVAVGGIYAFNSIKANRAPVADAPPVVKEAEKSAAPVAPKLALAPKSAEKPAALVVSKTVAPVSGARTYIVRAGDTVPKVAAQHATTVAELSALNNLKDTVLLKPGQTLTLPAAKPAPPAPTLNDSQRAAFLATRAGEATKKTPKVNPKTYTVAKGDTLLSITRKFSVGYDELVKLNKIDDPKKLQIGHTIKLPAPKTTAAN